MKTNYKIIIKENHPCAVEEIDHTPLSTEAYLHYKKKALENAVRFRDESEVRKHFFELDGELQDGLFNCPEGFEIVIGERCVTCDGLKCPFNNNKEDCTQFIKYATLKPLDAK